MSLAQAANGASCIHCAGHGWKSTTHECQVSLFSSSILPLIIVIRMIFLFLVSSMENFTYLTWINMNMHVCVS